MDVKQNSSDAEECEAIRIAVVAGRWHAPVVAGLVRAATEVLEETGCYFEVFYSPTTFETPVIVQALLQTEWDGVVALGVVIPGESARFQHLSRAITNGLSELALQNHKPVGFGILMVHSEEQGIERAGLPGSKESKGREAASSTIETVRLLRRIRQTGNSCSQSNAAGAAP